MLCRAHTALIGVSPAPSRSIPNICSSLNRLFFIVLPSFFLAELYFCHVHFLGGTSLDTRVIARAIGIQTPKVMEGRGSQILIISKSDLKKARPQIQSLPLISRDSLIPAKPPSTDWFRMRLIKTGKNRVSANQHVIRMIVSVMARTSIGASGTR